MVLLLPPPSVRSFLTLFLPSSITPVHLLEILPSRHLAPRHDRSLSTWVSVCICLSYCMYAIIVYRYRRIRSFTYTMTLALVLR